MLSTIAMTYLNILNYDASYVGLRRCNREPSSGKILQGGLTIWSTCPPQRRTINMGHITVFASWLCTRGTYVYLYLTMIFKAESIWINMTRHKDKSCYWHLEIPNASKCSCHSGRIIEKTVFPEWWNIVLHCAMFWERTPFLRFVNFLNVKPCLAWFLKLSSCTMFACRGLSRCTFFFWRFGIAEKMEAKRS